MLFQRWKKLPYLAAMRALQYAGWFGLYARYTCARLQHDFFCPVIHFACDDLSFTQVQIMNADNHGNGKMHSNSGLL
jgi:hypothetical protein